MRRSGLLPPSGSAASFGARGGDSWDGCGVVTTHRGGTHRYGTGWTAVGRASLLHPTVLQALSVRGKAHEDMLLNLDRLRGTIKEESQKLQGSVSQKIDSVRQARAECHAPLRRRPGYYSLGDAMLFARDCTGGSCGLCLLIARRGPKGQAAVSAVMAALTGNSDDCMLYQSVRSSSGARPSWSSRWRAHARRVARASDARAMLDRTV